MLACDGSMVELPDTNTTREEFGVASSSKDEGTGMAMGRVSVLYDLLNEIVLDSTISHYSDNERSMFDQHRNRIPSLLPKGQKLLFLMDRGYPSFSNLIGMADDGHKYVVRCSRTFCKEVEVFASRGLREDDLVIPLDDRNQASCSLKNLKNVPHEISLKIVRIDLSSGEQEYLLTNTNFAVEELYELYDMRWGVETFYGFLKDTMEVENFSSLLPEGIRQDFHAKILTSNLASIIIQDAQQEMDEDHKNDKRTRKFDYKINKNVAIGLLKDEIPSLIFCPEQRAQIYEELVSQIKRSKVPIKPNRSQKRERKHNTSFSMNRRRAG